MSCFTDLLSVGNICDSIKRSFSPRFLKTVCPHCQKIYRLPYKFDEKFIECPNCKQSFWVERYRIPVRFSGIATTDYEKKIHEILERLGAEQKTVTINNSIENLSLTMEDKEYFITLKSGDEVLYSVEINMPQWKLKKLLIYFCTGEYEWKNMISWTVDVRAWMQRKHEIKERKIRDEEAAKNRIRIRQERVDLFLKVMAVIVYIAICVIVAWGVGSCAINSSHNNSSVPSPTYYEPPKHPYMEEPGKAYMEGFLERMIKEETGLDSKATMKYNEATGKIYFDVKYSDE